MRMHWSRETKRKWVFTKNQLENSREQDENEYEKPEHMIRLEGECVADPHELGE